MSKGTVNIVELFSSCIDLAQQAGIEIRNIALSGQINAIAKDADGKVVEVAISEKDVIENGTDAVTQADLMAQKIIEGTLRAEYPGLQVVGEEDIDPADYVVKKSKRDLINSRVPQDFQAEYPIEDVVVFIDPLDATQEFVIGNRFCTITLVGVAVKGKAVGGVMYQPFQNEGRTVWGLVGVGAFDDEVDPTQNVLTNPQIGKPRDELVVVTTRLHNSEAVENALKAINVPKVVRVGGAGYKVLKLLDGFADFYLYPTKGTKKWDTCAPEAILKVLGGKMSDCKGDEISYNFTDNVHNMSGVFASRLKDTHDAHVVKLK